MKKFVLEAFNHPFNTFCHPFIIALNVGAGLGELCGLKNITSESQSYHFLVQYFFVICKLKIFEVDEVIRKLVT